MENTKYRCSSESGIENVEYEAYQIRDRFTEKVVAIMFVREVEKRIYELFGCTVMSDNLNFDDAINALKDVLFQKNFEVILKNSFIENLKTFSTTNKTTTTVGGVVCYIL